MCNVVFHGTEARALVGDTPMLVLTRRYGEEIVIGRDVVITVVHVSPQTVKLGILAPETTVVTRRELLRPPNWCTAPPGYCLGVSQRQIQAGQCKCGLCEYVDRAKLKLS